MEVCKFLIKLIAGIIRFYTYEYMKRTFIAISVKPEPALRELFAELREKFRYERIRWMNIDRLHLTLVFIAHTSCEAEKQVNEAIVQTLGTFNAGNNTKTNIETFPGQNVLGGSFAMSLRQLGVFPGISRPRVLWLGLEDAGQLKRFREELVNMLLAAGLVFDNEKKFVPHLTIARIRYMNDTGLLKDLLEKYKGTSFQPFVPDRIQYFESILKAEGAEYKLLAEYLL